MSKALFLQGALPSASARCARQQCALHVPAASAVQQDIGKLVTVVDLSDFLGHGQQQSAQICQAAAQQVMHSLRSTNCVLVRDPRVTEADNDTFLNLMESYFARSTADKLQDARPELAYQVGATPSGVETPRCCFDEELRAQIAAQRPPNRATMPTGPDVKWRFFWRVGPRPAATAFPDLNADLPPVLPRDMPGWSAVMDAWGAKLLGSALAVSELLAIAYGLPPHTFVDLLREGPHLLAPTGTDLVEHGTVGTVFAGYHYDMNFLTIHGRARYPGLHIWLRDGTRVPVRLPPGCLLLQAGRQLEILTGGDIMAGMHEVICTDETLAAAKRAAAAGGLPPWRVSSTVFAHARSDAVLAPLAPCAGAPGAARYAATTAGAAVRAELAAIKLKRRAAA